MRAPKFTVRRLMIMVAAVASVLCLAAEFSQGVPARSVVMGIAARLEKLNPGMGYRQVVEMLGLEKSWLKGGISSLRVHGEPMPGSITSSTGFILR